MKYEITEEQIKEIHECLGYAYKIQIEEWFPEFFKSKLEVGKWYKDTSNGLFMFCFSGKYASHTSESNNYGINAVGIWREGLAIHNDIDYTLCTTEEVKSMLIKEAENRGFKTNTTFVNLDRNEHCKIGGDCFMYCHKRNIFYASSGYADVLFDNGKWATIVEIPKEMTVEEIEKQLGHKVKIVS